MNEGEPLRYLRKPWDNAELQADVADAVAALEAPQAGATGEGSPRSPSAVLVIERAP